MDHPRIFTPPDPRTVPFMDKDARAAMAAANDASGLTYFQSKLIQPDWRQITFNGATNVTQVEDPWYGSWDVQSILVVNPYLFPVWVSANGDPVGYGMPFPPSQALRVPISGQGGALVLGVDPTLIEDNIATVQVFRYATPD